MLLTLDFQQALLARLPTAALTSAERTVEAVRCAREAGLRVGHVRLAFRPGYPELAHWNHGFGHILGEGLMVEGHSGTRIHPALGPERGEFVVTKSRLGAFDATDLGRILRAADITTLILTGVTTTGTVLATTIAAADRDYRVLILKDCVADLDPLANRSLLETVLPLYADIIELDDLITHLSHRPEPSPDPT
ncbi:cysteine hydrolase [Nocardia yamanashiensis]|uniref:isochorismatase family protein n=1 Tax=Nocardia yamanashiensis TaxID=209247 RepID=UPI001E42DE0A|nr:isochorismatase family protein [Nocardia yamanashiensis]UGT42579.1 cysteine hydrolase [Nocardia yamanashiensis]